MSFRRLAIVNRGEPAMRVIHAVRELNGSREEPIRLIALYTEPERHATWVLAADESYSLGSPTFVDPEDGGRKGRYLDYAALGRALRETEADAAWVGWGFVAEHPAFAELCERLGVAFIGPSAETMRRIGDKIEAKRVAEAVGVPVAAWSGGPVETIEEAKRHAAEIGYPLMIKATAGGGGRGIRRVDREGQLAAAFEQARSEARKSFGDGTVLMERLVAPARHVEVQVIADSHGRAWAVGVRDCSLQRRNQKVIEESSSPALDGDRERELRDAAVRLALETGYVGAATVEFLFEPGSWMLSFLEVNARLQVEHPVTEMVTGLDLVKLQIQVAEGARLEGEPPPASGHAIEARLNAEDPGLDFAPAPGRVELLRLPTGPGLRLDTGVAEGDVIPAEFDSMIAKLIAWGRDRDEALVRLRRALGETIAVLDDGTTNHGFLLKLLDEPDVREGNYDTGWLDRRQLQGGGEPVQNADAALIQAAIELHDAEVAADRARFYAFARRGRPEARSQPGSTVELRCRDCDYRFHVAQTGPSRYDVDTPQGRLDVSLEWLDAYERRLGFAGRMHRTVIARQGAQLRIEVDGVPHRVAREERGVVRAAGPGVVVSIPVEPGDEVEPGDVVAVVESMKMESSLTCPFHGRVTEVLSGANVQVPSQAPLVRIAPMGEDERSEAAEPVSFPVEPEGPDDELGERCAETVRRLQQLVLGYDITEEEARQTAERLPVVCSPALGCDPRLVPEENRLLSLFADLSALARPRHDPGDAEAELVRSPQEHLHSYLRSLDPKAEGLPESFEDQLALALAHYGVDDLERTPELEEACHRMFLAQQRVGAVQPAIVAILERRLEGASEIDPADEDLRELLDRVVAATEHSDPVVADLARAVLYRYFDEPVIDAAREAMYAEMEEHLAALTDDPERADREERVHKLVACPQPLAPLLTRRIGSASPGLRNVLIQAMTGRYHRQHPLTDMHFAEVDGIDFLLANRLEQHTSLLAVAFGDLAALPDTVRALGTLAAGLRDGEELIADFYAEYTGPVPSRDELSATIADRLHEVGPPPQLKQLVVAVAEPQRGRGMSAVDLFTFKPDGEGMAEDRSLRGLHPGMADRLRLWRLREFELERLPSAEDVYLFRGVARENSKDERLFALAEVRDVTPVYDSDGDVVAVPELERMLSESFEAMRTHLAHLPARKRPLWNRVMLHAWPVIELTAEQIRTIVERHAPATNGLGIEMVLLHGRVREPGNGWKESLVRFFKPAGSQVFVELDEPPQQPVQPLDDGALRVIAARRRGTLHPAEIVKLLGGQFEEHDLDDDGRLVPVARPPATNTAGIVVGLTRAFSERYPEGMLRVALLGDPTKALGSLAEPECRRIMAALDLAEELGVPLEWFALSAGAKIAMDSGTENMDWIAAVLRRIIEFTQRGNELNVVVTGINVGAQPYWNAEATMLMHTKGILVMTPESAMVLTGKQSLDYSGGVSAEDNAGIGGYERIMGPNGQAQYWAPDLAGACQVLLSYYEHTYVAPGERFPRRAETTDPFEREAGLEPHHAPGSDLARVGDIYSEANPERKKPFEIRSVMRATIDKDRPPLERWAGMEDAEIAVVWDAHMGGWPVSVIGFESRPLPRHGALPADGPGVWTSGTLFPRSSKKVARALNAASGRRPVVVLANLAGFDGSPESMRSWQLEFGAEIGRAVVNFAGPIVFCVVSRYHGGAFVVFSQKLNEGLEAVALEGARASVIGGAPAAGVVFAREVDLRTRNDERVASLDERIVSADEVDRIRLQAERAGIWSEVRSEKLGELAAEFDAAHSVERAVRMGSVSKVVPGRTLRPYLIDAVERGIERTLGQGERANGRPGLVGQRSG